MKRKDYISMLNGRKSINNGENNVIDSVADPTQAQSGRDLVFNPKPLVNNRITYAEGVSADKLQPFDKMYADKLEVFAAAQHSSKTAREKINEFNSRPIEQEKPQE